MPLWMIVPCITIYCTKGIWRSERAWTKTWWTVTSREFWSSSSSETWRRKGCETTLLFCGFMDCASMCSYKVRPPFTDFACVQASSQRWGHCRDAKNGSWTLACTLRFPDFFLTSNNSWLGCSTQYFKAKELLQSMWSRLSVLYQLLLLRRWVHLVRRLSWWSLDGSLVGKAGSIEAMEWQTVLHF